MESEEENISSTSKIQFYEIFMAYKFVFVRHNFFLLRLCIFHSKIYNRKKVDGKFTPYLNLLEKLTHILTNFSDQKIKHVWEIVWLL
jgi:hypothetical protein